MTDVSSICSLYLKICEQRKNLSKYTLKAYRLDLAQFELIVGSDLGIARITKVELANFHHKLVELELAPSSIKRKIACVRAMFRWLELDEVIQLNPFHQFRAEIKLPRKLPKNVAASELHKMIQCGKSDLGMASHATYQEEELLLGIETKKSLNKLSTLMALELMLSTGMRVGELAGICISNIDIDERKIKILGKGARERYVYLPDADLCELTRAYIKARQMAEPKDSNFLVNSRGSPASTQFLRKLIKNIAIRASTKSKVTPHMLRHSAACELLESGLDIRFVQRLLGHSSISTTEIYTHVSDSLLKEKVTLADVRGRIMKK